jgi:hypothetical protein
MTKRKLWFLLAATLLAVGAIVAGVAIRGAEAENGGTNLRGFDEVPALSIPGAFAQFQLNINDASQTISFRMRWTGLTGPPTQSHVHIGQPGVNGGVSAFFCGGSTKPACPQATTAQIQGTITPADVIGPAGQGVAPGEWGELVQAIRAGYTYANIHTQAFPGGEIRGQISVD